MWPCPLRAVHEKPNGKNCMHSIKWVLMLIACLKKLKKSL